MFRRRKASASVGLPKSGMVSGGCKVLCSRDFEPVLARPGGGAKLVIVPSWLKRREENSGRSRGLNRRAEGAKGSSRSVIALALFAMWSIACSGDGAREDPVDPAHGAEPDADVGEAGDPTTAAWDRELEPGPMTKT